MKTFFKNYFFLLPFLTLLLVGCEDDDEPIVDPLEPVIESISPEEGVPGTVVTLTGEFEGVTEVLIDDEEVADFNLAADNSTITFTIPEDQEAGFVTITVAREGGSDDVQFTVLGAPVGDPEPVITSISPEEGLHGTEVTLEGTLEGVTEVRIADRELEEFDLAEDGSSLTFTVPEGIVTGAVEVRVTNAAGSAEITFTIIPAVAALTFEPASGQAGTEVTISGADFTDATSVMMGDTEITDIDVADDGSTITFTIPQGAQTGQISVVSPDQTLESAEEFVVEETQGITFNPVSGPVGTLVTLTGMDFTGVNAVMLGSMEITDVEVPTDGSSLTFEVPQGAQSGTIQVGEMESTGEFMVTEESQAINTNGGFENTTVGEVGSDSGPATVEGWNFGGDGLAVFSIVDEDVRVGEQALAVEVQELGTNPWDIEVSQEGIEVDPNTNYSYSIWTKGPAGTTASFTVGARLEVGGENRFPEFAREDVVMTGEWQQVSFDFTTTATIDGQEMGISEIRTPIHLSQEGNVGQTILIDHLQIVPAE